MEMDSEVFFRIRLLWRWQAQFHIYWWNWNKR